MTTEIIKLTATELKPFSFQFSTKTPDLTDKVDWSESRGTIKINGAELQCENNGLIITADFEIDYKVSYSHGDFYTPSETTAKFHTPIVTDWKITDEDGSEVEFDTLAETKFELSLITFLEDTFI